MADLKDLLVDDPELASILWRALEIEDAGNKEWSWVDVGAHPAQLSRMARNGILSTEKVAINITYYRLIEPQIIRSTMLKSDVVEAQARQTVMFENIVGFDDIKEYIRLSLKSSKALHVLLIGPPGCAKSLLISELKTLPNSRIILGGSTRKAGLTRYLMENEVKYLILDEADKATRDELSSLLSVMEDQFVAEMKTGRTGYKEGIDCRVFAACNREDEIPPELLSRFAKFRFREYRPNEFIEVTRRTLMLRENVAPNLASYIAETCYGNGLRDVRDAVRVARIAKNEEEASWAIVTMRRYGKV